MLNDQLKAEELGVSIEDFQAFKKDQEMMSRVSEIDWLKLDLYLSQITKYVTKIREMLKIDL